jgi:hypothetical protein
MLLEVQNQWKSGQEYQLKVERDERKLFLHVSLTQAFTTSQNLGEERNPVKKTIITREKLTKAGAYPI